MRKQVLVLGGNFGGLTAALELKYELGEDVEVTVVSASDRFLFNPSLIWLPFGKRSAADITFALEPTFDAHGIGFVHAEATAIDPAARTVATTSGSYGTTTWWSPPASAISSTWCRAWAPVVTPRRSRRWVTPNGRAPRGGSSSTTRARS